MKSPVETSTKYASSFAYINNVLRSVLGDIESLRETFELVVPLLEKQDDERRKEVREAQLTLDRALTNAKDSGVNLPQIIDSTKVIRGHELRLRRARLLFQGNSIVSLVSRFDQFLAAINRFLLRLHPERLDNLSIPYSDLSQMSSVEELRSRFIRNEVEDLFRKAHDDQFKYLEGFIGPVNEEELWSAFVEIAERRNLHVHTGGRASRQYLDARKRVGIEKPEWLKEGSYLPVDMRYFNKACLTVSEMAFKIAQTVMRKSFPKNFDSADKSLLGIGLDFLQRGQHQLAEIIFDYGAQLNQKWTTNDGLRKTFLINKALACKLQGKNGECLSILKPVDWSSAHPRYLIAVHILRDELKLATSTLKILLKSNELTERQIFEWAVFTNFRESEECRSTFKEVLGRELGLSPSI